MTTAAQLLALAEKYLGYVEGPRNNETPFGAWAGAQFQPWCQSFTSFILDHEDLGIGKIAYCPAGVAHWRDQGQLFATPKVGDEFYLWFPSKNRYAHTGFVKAVDGAWIVTVEGNSNTAGSRTGGSIVSLRRKWAGTRTVFGRPAYDTPPTSPQPEDELMRHEPVVVVPPEDDQGRQWTFVDENGKVLGFDSKTSSVVLKASKDGQITPLVVQHFRSDGPTWKDALAVSFAADLQGTPAPVGAKARIVIEHR